MFSPFVIAKRLRTRTMSLVLIDGSEQPPTLGWDVVRQEKNHLFPYLIKCLVGLCRHTWLWWQR